MSEHTGASYAPVSKHYAGRLEDDDRAPYNACYERPVLLSLLPELAGLRLLDAGCGTGRLAAVSA